MKLYSSNNDYKLYQGNMLDMLDVIESNSIDSIVTDPPYGLTSITKRFGKENSAECQYGKDGSFARLSRGFMGKEWDGSGSTGKAVMYENKERNKNYKYIGIELTEEYLPIAKARIEYVCKLTEEEKNEERQLSIYDLQ